MNQRLEDLSIRLISEDWWSHPKGVAPHFILDPGGPHMRNGAQGRWVPDLTHPSTAGVLLQLLSDAAPRRIQVSMAGVFSHVRIRMLGRQRSASRSREPQQSWGGKYLGEAAGLALLDIMEKNS